MTTKNEESVAQLVNEEITRIRKNPEESIKSLFFQSTDMIMEEIQKDNNLLVAVGSAVNLIVKINGLLMMNTPKESYLPISEEIIKYLLGLQELNKRDNSDTPQH